MVSAGVCFGGKGRLHFVPEKVKLNADFYVNDLLPKRIEDCEGLLPNNFIFHQDGAPAHSLASLKIGSSSVVRSSSRRMSDHQTHLTSILSIPRLGRYA